MARHPVSSGPWLEEMEYRPLTDADIRRLWRMAHDAPPYTWRDRARYRLSWRPRWAVRLWRRIR